MTYAELYRALCALNITYSWTIQVQTWLHEKIPQEPRTPRTEWKMYLLPTAQDCFSITKSSPEELLEAVKSYLETGTLGGRELETIGDCKTEETQP